MTLHARDRNALLVLALLQLVVWILVAPRGDFPLNDDWAYSHSVRWLLEERRVRLSDWVAMNLLPQTLLGAATASLLGFSFETLRHVTQVVAVACSAIAYAWFRAGGLAASHALAATCALLAFPAWPVLANSYMTDIYGLAPALASAALFVRCLRRWDARLYALAIALAILGALQRQVVLVVPLAWLAAMLAVGRPYSARSLALAAAPLAAAFAASAAYQYYLAAGPGMPTGMATAQGRLLPLVRKALLDEEGHGRWVLANAATIAGYLGLFLAGWAAWWGCGGARTRRARLVILAGFALALACIAAGWLPPYRASQVIDRVGIGPIMTHDAVRGLAPLDRSVGTLWLLAGVVAAFGTAALAAALVAGARLLGDGEPFRRQLAAFLLTAVAAYLLPFVFTDYFDRYLLFVLPFLIALWALAIPPRAAGEGALLKALGGAALAASLALSAAATHDYFAWNRARWAALDQALRLGATPAQIDGGFEFNALHGFEARATGTKGGPSWWWVKDDRFVVAFRPVSGYEVAGRWPVAAWLPRTPREVLLLRRTP